MSTHTPGPWRVVHTADDRTFIDTEESNDNFIAQIDRNVPEYEENAAFIARACNAHEELVQALKELLKRSGETETDGIGLEHDSEALEAAYIQAENAIAKAEGRA